MEKVKNKKQSGSLRSILVHADFTDKCLMVAGFTGAALDGLSTPIVFYFTAQMINSMGAASTFEDRSPLNNNINERCLILLYVAVALLFFGFLVLPPMPTDITTAIPIESESGWDGDGEMGCLGGMPLVIAAESAAMAVLILADECEGYCWTRAADRLAARMRANYLKAVLRQDISYFDLHLTSTSDIITTVTSDTVVIQDFLGEKLPNLLIRLFMFAGSYIAAFAMLWRLAIVAAPFYVFLIVPGMVCGSKLMRIAKNMRVEYNKAGNIVEQAVASIRTVYAFAGEKMTLFNFSTALEGTLQLGLRQGLVKGLAVGSGGINYAIWAFMAYYGSRMVMYHGAQGGTVYSAVAVMGIGGGAFGFALSNLKYFSEASSAGERILQMINRVPEIDPNNEQGHILQTLDGKIQFKHVVFAYPSRPENIIFKDFCLIIPARKTVALVGESGSGKSTVVSLLQRFYNPQGGEILLDGFVIDKLQIKWLRSQMGLVSQEPALFATSIRENILFGKEDASMDEVIEAAKASNAHNFISKLPLGYETQVGERGVQMSGGQKQRIAIARAIIRSPRIILFDEATSALDSESERIVQEALDRASIGRTTITIAHRLSTIRNVDMIAVVQNGQVMETGSHEELTRNANSYYNTLLGHQETKNDRSENDKTDRITPYPESDIGMNNPNPISNDHQSTMAEKSGSKDEKFAAPSFRRLLALNSPEWKQGIAGCLSAALVGAIQPVFALALGSLISVFFLKDHEEVKKQIRTFTFCFLGLAIFSLLITVSQHYTFTYMGEHLTKRVREKMLSKILTFEVGWFDRDKNSSGAICSRFAKDANMVRSLVGDRMALLIVASSATVIAFTMSLVIAWRLAVVMIAAQPLIIFVIYARRVLLKNLSEKSIKSQDGSSKLAAEAVSNYRTVTAFSSQVRFVEMFEQSQQGMVRESIKQSWYAGLVLGFAQFFTKCIWALDFWYGGKLMSEGYVTSREFFQTFLILIITGFVIADAGSTTSDIAKGSDAVASLFAILDRETMIRPDNPQSFRPEKIEGEVEFTDVDFAYPTRPEAIVLKDFSFKIEAGKSTALVGPSGSGKSTLIGLIERFYDPIKGTVKIDGRDIRSYHLRSLREHIALVSQEPPLFAGTIRENIVYGVSNEVSEAEIIEAAKSANAHDFIVTLKDGYDTRCGDRGVQLSGGQKQRVAIARAVLRNPTLLLLDEATSALDSQSEKVVHEALERLMVQRRRTSIVVAHRLSTIRNCDTIAVLDKGKVVEIGNHGSLVAKGPGSVYYSLLNLQTASDSANDVE